MISTDIINPQISSISISYFKCLYLFKTNINALICLCIIYLYINIYHYQPIIYIYIYIYICSDICAVCDDEHRVIFFVMIFFEWCDSISWSDTDFVFSVTAHLQPSLRPMATGLGGSKSSETTNTEYWSWEGFIPRQKGSTTGDIPYSLS